MACGQAVDQEVAFRSVRLDMPRWTRRMPCAVDTAGISMRAGCLTSSGPVEVSVCVFRAVVRMREVATNRGGFAGPLAELEDQTPRH
jgi:hypothetical protein